MDYYDRQPVLGPQRSVQVVDSRPTVYGASYSYNPTSLVGMIVAIVIMIIAIVVVIWLIQAGISVANQVLANGAKRGFPIPYIIGIVLAIIVVIVTIILIIWVINLARGASRAATGLPPLSSSISTDSRGPPIYRTGY